MKVFVAGGSGTIGIPLVRSLLEGGHHVTASTRSPAKAEQLRALGASAAIADALDREALMRVVADARPTHVVHQLTALPKDAPRRASDLRATNRLRIEGTRNLLDAAVRADARRFVVGSFAILSPRGPETPAERNDEGAVAVRSMETQVLDASKRGLIEGVVLRYGLFYGLDAPSTIAMVEMVRKRRLPVPRGDSGQLPLIHLEDAVTATVRALESAPAGSTYEIVDDRPASLTEIVEAIADYTGSPRPLKVPAWVLSRVRALHGAGHLSAHVALERHGESRTGVAAEVSNDARRAGAVASTRGVTRSR
jgi:nucleoside-diphosphate-sugar epimerase